MTCFASFTGLVFAVAKDESSLTHAAAGLVFLHTVGFVSLSLSCMSADVLFFCFVDLPFAFKLPPSFSSTSSLPIISSSAESVLACFFCIFKAAICVAFPALLAAIQVKQQKQSSYMYMP